MEYSFLFRECECGISDLKSTYDTKKQYPWQLLLTINWKKMPTKNVHCGGVLISEKHFVTAVRCLEDKEKGLTM